MCGCGCGCVCVGVGVGYRGGREGNEGEKNDYQKHNEDQRLGDFCRPYNTRQLSGQNYVCVCVCGGGGEGDNILPWCIPTLFTL